jgi:hypothetical protein
MPDIPLDDDGPAGAGSDAPPEAGSAPAAEGDDSAPNASRDVAPWKLVAVIVAVIVVAAGGLLAYHYRGKVFKSSSTNTSTTLSGPIPRVEDSFSRSDSTSIGKTTTGQQWNQVVGKWGVTGQQAYVSEPNSKGTRNMVVVNTGSGDGTVSAKAAHLTDGWGLLFRYQAPTGYWRLYWNTKFKALHLVKFENDKETDAIPGGFLAPTAHDGMEVRVEYLGPNITVFVDNVPVRTVSDTYLMDQTQDGMYIDKDGAADARWSSFVATSGAPATVRTAPVPKGGTATTGTAPGN